MGDRAERNLAGAATRRTVLRGALIAGVAAPLLSACGSDDDSVDSSPTTSGEPSDTGAGSSSDAGADSGAAAAAAIATKADVPEGSGIVKGDDGVVITQPSPGKFAGFSSTCTHMGCTVKDVTSTINCPCHGSQFSIEDGSPVNGPATKPLPAIELDIKGQNISLA